MLFRRKGTAIVYDVKEALLPLFEGNEAYEVVVKNDAVKEQAEKPKKPTTKKK